MMSSSELTAEIPAPLLLEPGVFEVTVHTPPPGGGSSTALDFTVLAPTPSLIGLSRTTAVAGDAGFTLTVDGTGFASTSVVRWDDTPLATNYTSRGRLSAIVPDSALEVDASVSVTVLTPAPGGGTSNTLTFTIAPSIREVALPTNDVIYHPATERVFASVPSSGGARANTITTIDPATGAILGSVPIGNEPGKLALSDDGTLLYVALDGTGEVRMLDVATHTPGTTFSLGTGTFGTRYVEDLAVAPGSPLSVAVSMKFSGVSPRHAGLAIFDNGVLRGTPTAEHSGPNVIEYSASPSTVYGLDNETDDGGVYTIDVGSSGPTVANVTQGLIRGTSDIAFAAGRLYGTTGAVVDPVALQVIGTFDVTDVSIFGSLIVVDPPNGRALFLEAGDPSYTATLHAFDLSTFQSIRSLAVPTAPGPASGSASLIRWGADGLAFRSASTVFFVRSSLVRR